MTFRRGDIVLARLPFTDLTASKTRPALVVQCDRNNRRLDDVILAMITSTIDRALFEPTQLLIDLDSPTGAAAGLLHTSVVKCERLITLHGSLLTRTIGHLPDVLSAQLDACLKESLGLS